MGCNICQYKKSKFAGIRSSSVISAVGTNSAPTPTRSKLRKLNNTKNLLQDSLLNFSSEKLELQNCSKLAKSKTSSQKSKMKSILLNHFLFNFLSNKHLKILIDKFKLYKYEANSVIFSQGSIGEYFYIIEEGMADVIINSEFKSTISKDICFGDLALIHNSTRTATIKTKVPTSVWVLKSSFFKKALNLANQSRYSDNKTFLETVPFFKILNQQQKLQILNLVICQDFKTGEKIVAEGDPGDIFYIIKQGSVTCSIKGTEIRTMVEGEFFGEQALIHTQQRTATITAASNVILISLGVQDLLKVFGSKIQGMIYKNSIMIAIEKCKDLKNLNSVQIEKISEKVIVQSFQEGEVVFKQGEKCKECFWFVLKGVVKGQSEEFDVFQTVGGRTADEEFKEDWLATKEVDIGVLPVNIFPELFQADLETILKKNELVSVLKQVDIFRPLCLEKLENLISVLKIEEYTEKSLVFKQGDCCDSLFIIKEGKVDIIKDGVLLRSLSSNNFFGEKSVLFSKPRSATVMCKINCKLWVLTKSNFLSIIDECLHKYLSKRILLQNESICLKDLKMIRFIGEGTFGKVFLVQHPKENAYYALKTIERWKVSDFNIYDNLLNERRILLQLDHPMLMKLVKTFKDDARLYFLCEYVEGIDLFDVLRYIHKIDESKAMFIQAA